jgi:hypothetical protein
MNRINENFEVIIVIIKVFHRLKAQLNEFLEPQTQGSLSLGSVGLVSGSTVSSLGSGLDSGSVYRA